MAIVHKMRAAWERRSSLRHLLTFSSASFSQYAEDLIFDRLLRPGRDGTYVDVGANHPIHGSNTYRLYTRGWKGLAIDPNPRFADAFRTHRPRDLFLAEGVSRDGGTLNYHAFTEDVFNTFDHERVQALLAEGRTLVGATAVPCRPLAEIVDEHLPARQIDLLNVDCEGLDLEVLASLGLKHRRPTVIIVEDYLRYLTFQRDAAPRDMEKFLRAHGYVPFAQTAWSALYVAEDWPELFARSAAFEEGRLRNGYLPGQESLPPE